MGKIPCSENIQALDSCPLLQIFKVNVLASSPGESRMDMEICGQSHHLRIKRKYKRFFMLEKIAGFSIAQKSEDFYAGEIIIFWEDDSM
jgi:hypothetical protein